MRTRTKKPKKVAYRFIPPDVGAGPALYALLRDLVDAHHPELADAKIALAWNRSWQPDVDGRVTLGQCKKVGDLEREVADLAGYDFIIILRQVFWDDEMVTDQQRRALLDHELCHAAVKLDEHGDPVIDERGRTVYRLRKHDVEEFTAISERYGCWKSDLEAFARALERARHDDRWVGYRSLQEQLRVAGASLPLEVITEWTEAQRREASRWARMRQDFPKFFDALPAFIAGAIPTEAPSKEVV